MEGAPVDVDAVRDAAQDLTRHARRVEAVGEAECSDEEGCGGAGMHLGITSWGLQEIASGKAWRGTKRDSVPWSREEKTSSHFIPFPSSFPFRGVPPQLAL